MTQSRRWALLEAFFRSQEKRRYKKGDVIISADQVPDGIYLIETGFVGAYSTTKYGEQNLLLLRGSGGIFPLIWAFTGETGQVSYETLEATTLWVASRADYIEFLDRNPDILPLILDMAIEAYRQHSQRVMTLSYRTARERLMSFLLNNAKRFGVTHRDGSITINAPYRQSDIASSINATRETTSRELNNLRKKGYIKIQEHKIILKNEKLLRGLL